MGAGWWWRGGSQQIRGGRWCYWLVGCSLGFQNKKVSGYLDVTDREKTLQLSDSCLLFEEDQFPAFILCDRGGFPEV